MTGNENNLTTFSGEVYQQLPYDMSIITIMQCVGELNIQVFLDNGCMFSIMLMHYYDSHNILQRCQKMPADNMVMPIGNHNIKVHFCIGITHSFNTLQYISSC